MMHLTDTTELKSLSYSLPALKHEVTVHLPGSDLVCSLLSPDSKHRVIEIPCGSHWEPGAHWHEEYTEHVRILQGRALVCINGQVQQLEADGRAVFRLFDIHNFCRADFDNGPSVLIEEWTDDGMIPSTYDIHQDSSRLTSRVQKMGVKSSFFATPSPWSATWTDLAGYCGLS